MKKYRTLFLFSILFIFLSSLNFDWPRIPKPEKNRARYQGIKLQSINQGQLFRQKGQRYVPGEVLVKFKPSLSTNSIEITINAYQAKTIKKMRRSNVYQLQIPESLTVEEMVWALERNPDVECACPNYIVYITAVREPNDTFFDYQYALRNTGQDIGIPGSPHGIDRADIKALEGWEETEGSEEIIIAVIDTGIDFEHPDLKNEPDLEDKILSNGYDFVDDDEDPFDEIGNPIDGAGHGTWVTSIATAKTDNNEGIAGVAWNCKILPLRTIDIDGTGPVSGLIDAIYYAVDKGADVINMSLGFPLSPGEEVPPLEDALQYAHMNGVVCVASAGNDGTDVLFPAAYDDYCIAVAATNYDDERVTRSNSQGRWESNIGDEIDVAAPGKRIVGCVPLWYWGEGSIPYGFGDGTSASVPYVVGLVALIKSIKPWLSVDEIMDVVRFSADDTNNVEHPGKDEFIGYGRINMEKALVPIIITK
jgi:thermitase